MDTWLSPEPAFTAEGLSGGTVYYFKVKAVFPNDLCTLTGPFTAAVSCKALNAFKAPSGVAVKQTAVKTLSVSWAANADATQYNVYRNVNGGAFTYKTTVYTNAYTDTDLTAGKTYGYKIMSVYKKGGATITGSFYIVFRASGVFNLS